MKDDNLEPKKNKKIQKKVLSEDTPKPVKKKSVKKSIPASEEASDVIPVTDIPAYVHDAIKQAFLRFYDKASLKQAHNTELNHLDGIVSEYLDHFILLGFDVLGQKVSLVHATSHCGKDALVEHLRTTLLQIIGSDNH